MSIFTTCECKNAARIYRFNNLDLKLFLIKNVFCTLAKQYHLKKKNTAKLCFLLRWILHYTQDPQDTSSYEDP